MVIPLLQSTEALGIKTKRKLKINKQTMAFYMKAGLGPKQKTGAGIPSVLLQQTPATDEKKGTNKHPGFDQSYHGRGFQASTEEGGDVANVLNERAYNEEVKKAKAWEAKNEFPTVDSKLKGRLDKFRVNSIDPLGNYTLSPKDGFRANNNKTVTREQMKQHLQTDTYDPYK